MKEITVIGAGFCGLAAAYYLAKEGFKVHILDPNGIGGGASGVSAGLLHPFAGLHAKRNFLGFEALTAAKALIAVATEALGYPVIQAEGLLRPAVTDRQKMDFAQSAEENDEVEWLEKEKVEKIVSAIVPHPGIYIRNAVAVDVKAYLCGLSKACENLGVSIKRQRVGSLNEIRGPYIVTAGHAATSLIRDLPITPVKGQILRLVWPEGLPPLPFPVNSRAYIVMDRDKKSCWVGATFEHHFDHEGVDLAEAKGRILPLASAIIPELNEANILDCQVGVRASTPDKKPVLKQVDKDAWVLTGMGSKGLLYHALYAKKLLSFLLTTFAKEDVRLSGKVEEKDD